MATDSKMFTFSLKRCNTPPRRRESSPRSYDTKPSRKSPLIIRDMDKRNRGIRSRSGRWYRDRTRENHRSLKTTRSESSIRRITSYSRYSKSNYPHNGPKTLKKENSERRREDSPFNPRHLCRSYYSKTYDNRREQRRHVARSSRERSPSRDGIRREECYDVKNHTNFSRIPMTIPENYKCRSRLVIPTPPPIAVPRPGRILLPARLVPRLLHMRLPFPARLVRNVAPVLLAPVVILREPMMPLRPPVPVTTSRLC